jgi:hypothetical protein
MSRTGFGKPISKLYLDVDHDLGLKRNIAGMPDVYVLRLDTDCK